MKIEAENKQYNIDIFYEQVMSEKNEISLEELEIMYNNGTSHSYPF